MNPRYPRAQDRTKVRVERIEMPVLRTRGELQVALDALTAFDVGWLTLHPSTPRLYDSGVRYKREPRGREKWQTIPLLFARGFGDCEDLACARAAELIVHHGITEARAIPYRTRSGGWHIVVQVGPTETEDPSSRARM